MHRLLILIGLLALLAIGSFQTTEFEAHAAIEQRQFADPSLAARYQALIAELRCLVCQNQNLADSDASLALDLRDKTAEMLIAGKSDQEILDYMSARYGEFVLYRPPFNAGNAVLWLGPFLVLMLVLGMLIMHLRKRQAASSPAAHQLPPAQREQVRNILETAPTLPAADQDRK